MKTALLSRNTGAVRVSFQRSPSTPQLTVAVPTCNRGRYLRETLDSILQQDFRDFQVVVFDNASEDDVGSLIRSLDDPRVRVNRSPVNIGMIRNWNRCLSENRSPYIALCHDDDVLRPGHLSQAVAALESNPSAAFAYAHAQVINSEGEIIQWPVNQDNFPPGLIAGSEFIRRMVSADRSWTVFPSGVVYRASALRGIGAFDSPHHRMAIDTNLLYRLARRFQVIRLSGDLVAQRVHVGQETEAQLRRAKGSGQVGILAEQLDGLMYLLETPRANEPEFRQWLGERIRQVHRRKLSEVHSHLPDLYWDWNEQLRRAQEELDRALPPGAPFILVDEDQWGMGREFRGRAVWPFPERDGLFWGLPANEQAALDELRRLRSQGIRHIVFPWSSGWWLEHYASLGRELTEHCECVLGNPRLHIYRIP